LDALIQIRASLFRKNVSVLRNSCAFRCRAKVDVNFCTTPEDVTALGFRKKTRIMPLPDRRKSVTIVCIHLDTIPELEGRTDGRTDGQTDGSAVTISRASHAIPADAR